MKGSVPLMKFFGKYARLSGADQRLRLSLLDWGLTHGGEIPPEEALAAAEAVAQDQPAEWAGQSPQDVLDRLEAAHYFRRSGQGGICYLYPYSAYPTDYHVTLSDGRSFYAMCAIDAMGSAVTFRQPIKIRSRCRDTKEELLLRLTPEDGLTEARPDDQIIATYYDTSTHYIAFNC